MTRRTLLLLRWGIFLAACAFLYVRLFVYESTYTGLAGLRSVGEGATVWFWGGMLALAVLNWGMEAVKWRWLVAHLGSMSLLRAFAATLAGTTIGTITPNRTGEFMGRVLFLAPGHRWQGGFATLLGSIAQFLATVVFGGAALALLWWSAPTAGAVPWGGVAMSVLVVLVAGGALGLYFRPRLLRQFILMVPLLRRLGGAAQVLEGYSGKDLLLVLLMSMARYIVFGAQYILFLYTIADVAWPDALLAVPVIFLITTLVPTMLLTELGVRGSVAVALLTPLGNPAGPVLLASFGVWLVNVALPAAIGGLIILSARIRTRR